MLLCGLAWPCLAAEPPRIDHGRLIVEGEPYLILGGELGNSQASDPACLETLWPGLTAAGLNTVLTPVTWEQIEPVEGSFDFTVTDAVIDQARAHNMHLVLLWFGAWKNSMSSYAPAWVKHDGRRFARVRTMDGRAQDMLSAFDPDTEAATVAAFAALMKHVKAVDPQHTVIMIQVENEVGMLPEARDHAAAADAAFKLQKDGEEIFQARAYARFVEAEARAGKAAYALPMYVNAALNAPGKTPGQYPSGGPLPHLFDIWKQAAPDIDLLAPDIYRPDFVAMSDAYAAANPLFVPEGNRAGTAEVAADAFYAVGEHRALGFSPFAIDKLPSGDALPAAYALLRELTPFILDHSDSMQGLKAAVAYDGTVDATPRALTLGGYDLTANYVDPWTPKDQQAIAAHGAILINIAPDTFVFAGSGVTLTLPSGVGIEQDQEGHVSGGQFQPGRWLNGDETHQGRHLRLPPDGFSLQRFKLYRYS